MSKQTRHAVYTGRGAQQPADGPAYLRAGVPETVASIVAAIAVVALAVQLFVRLISL